MSHKVVSASCERNQIPIAIALEKFLGGQQKPSKTLLEIGSGTGQHAVFLARKFPSIIWQPSDVAENLPYIEQWVVDSATNNCLSGVELNLNSAHWQANTYDYIFTANTLHIVSWDLVEALIHGVKTTLKPKGLLFIYGPFNYGGQYTSASNQTFDQWLKQRDALSGIRDIERIITLAKHELPSLKIIDDIEMPANNRLLVFEKG